MRDKTLPITGIGSLAHKNIVDSVSFSLKFHIPFLPQLTSLNESMIPQAKTGQYLALEEFSSRINQSNMTLFKIQIAGPSTSKVEHSQLFKNINHLVSPFKHKPIIFLDEPLLEKDFSQTISLIKKLKENEFFVGIHTCNNKYLLELLKQDIDYLSIDGKYLNLIESSKELTFFLKNNKKLVLGIYPTDTRSISEDEIFNRYKDFIFSNRPSIIFSPACGLAHFTNEQTLECLLSLKSLRQRFINQT